MNLLSLPDEMLANVFKFTKFETLVLLRKMNGRINAVTQRYGINKPKFVAFTAYKNVLELIYRTIDIQEDYKNAVVSRESYPNIQMGIDSSNSLMKWHKKIRDVQSFSFQHREIDDNTLDLLASIKQKNRIRVIFYLCNFKVSLEAMEKALSRFGLVRIFFTTENTILNENFASDKVMCSLFSYAGIILEPTSNNNNVFLPAVTDKTLIELQRYLPRCFMLKHYFPNFTIAEIIRTIKVEFLNGETPKKCWNFGRIQIGTREEYNRVIEELRTIEGITVTHFLQIANVKYKDIKHYCIPVDILYIVCN